MSQIPDALSCASDPSPGRLFFLASELERGPEAVQLRLEEKRGILLSAWVLFSAGDGVQTPGAGTDNQPRTSYEGGTAPRGGSVTGGCFDNPS
jgi:hypothetical protein